MKSLLMLAIFVTVGCSDDRSATQESQSLTVYDTEQEAQENSPIGQACLISGEYKEEIICVPTNRGKNGKCEDQLVITDTRLWEIAFARGDVDYNGTVGDREDAQLATKKIYVKQFDNQPCPAAGDIAPHEGIHDSFDPDGFLTSNDINKWREVKRLGYLPIADEHKIICASECQIPNHMKK